MVWKGVQESVLFCFVSRFLMLSPDWEPLTLIQLLAHSRNPTSIALAGALRDVQLAAFWGSVYS